MSRITHQEFSFRLNEPGFATAVYTTDGIETEFELSNVCNPLTDMLVAVASLITNPAQLWDGSNTSAFTWYSEKESYDWTLTALQDGTLRIRVTQSCEFFGDDEVEVVNGECTMDEFVACITRELDRFLKSTGLLNYHQQWQTGEFPTTYFLILKKHLIDSGLWDAPAEGEGNILDDEMGILAY
ncbi:MAG: hypothetical protein ACI35Q_07100 [Marinilabiliaceae bacterium]